MPALAEREFGAYLDDSRHVVLAEIRRFVPQRGRLRPVLYDLVLDYPLRAAKALRPALCIATCRALGGRSGDRAVPQRLPRARRR
jgi:geranylgeranyl diphosphate synthase type II